MHQRFFKQLKERLEQSLPGIIAQQRMASSIRQTLRLKANPDAYTRQSAVLILLYPSNGIVHVPLILRPVYRGVHSGQVGFPGGRAEESDKDLIATALREAQEEIGIQPESVEIVGLLSPLFVPASNFIINPVVGATSVRPAFVPDPREVDTLLEVPLDELRDVNKIGEKEISVGDISVRAPYYDLQGQTVWGATAMVLSEFLVVLEEVI